MKQNPIRFSPGFNKIFKHTTSIVVKVKSDFPYAKLKNLFILYFVSACQSLLKVFLKSKNIFRFAGKKLKSTFELFLKAKQQIKMKNRANVSSLYLYRADSDIRIENQSDAWIGLYFKNKGNENFRFDNRLKTQLVIWYQIYNDLIYTTNATSQLQIQCFASSDWVLIHAAKLQQDLYGKSTVDLHVESNSIPTIGLSFSLFNSNIVFESRAGARVFIPIIISELYDDKIENWYDNSIANVFFGQELL